MAMRRLFVLACLLLTCTAAGQSVGVKEFAGIRHVSLHDVAAGLGQAATRMGDSFTLRTPFGVLTLFGGSRDALWRPESGTQESELRLEMPLREADGGLWVPESLFTQIGGTISGRVVLLPDRTRLLLDEEGITDAATRPFVTLSGTQSEAVELANGVRGVRLYSGEQSLLLVDLSLLSLAFPDRQGDYDALALRLQGERPIYFVLTSREDATPEPELTLTQAGAAVRTDMLVASGSFESLGPDSPVSGVILLPARFNPRAQVTVQWQGVNATVVFRR